MKNHPKEKIVLTLDAGGTNFVFTAIQSAREIVAPVHLPSNGHDLNLCLQTIINGFEKIAKQLNEPFAAISFAFPGPADYVNGIIGDLGNLPAFRGGVALGNMLEEKFKVPVFINNDGDLFAYGEYAYGLLPKINAELEKTGSSRKFKNLIGITLGTGFGGGLVRNGELILGDNGAAGEVWLMRNSLLQGSFAEESISARAISLEYMNSCAEKWRNRQLTPLDIYQIAKGKKQGDQQAAKDSFKKLGYALGSVLADVITLFDAPVVIGGGISNGWDLFFPEMLLQLNSNIANRNGKTIPRLVMKVFNLEQPDQFVDFVKGDLTHIKVPFSDRTVAYDPQKRSGIGVSHLGASKSVALGAYAFALNELEK
ncbi:MAG: ROK family protein [Bacteroidota bacterium]